MSRVVVRYRVRPPGLSCYRSTVLADGLTFVHEVDGDSTALRELPAFQRPAWTVGERCDDPPQQSVVRVLGRFEGRTS